MQIRMEDGEERMTIRGLILAMFMIGSTTAIAIVALSKGINGHLMTSCIGLIGTIAGYAFGRSSMIKAVGGR